MLNDTLLQLLKAIHAYATENHYAPTMRELMQLTRTTSTSVVAYRLQELRARGLVNRPPKGRTRAIALTESGIQLIASKP